MAVSSESVKLTQMDKKSILENIPPPIENTIDSKNQQHYSRKEVSRHSSYDSCWIFIGNSVYDVTEYFSQHPGGAEIILEFAGSDATSSFLGKGHSKAAVAALKKYFIGQIIAEDCLYAELDVLIEEMPESETTATTTPEPA